MFDIIMLIILLLAVALCYLNIWLHRRAATATAESENNSYSRLMAMFCALTDRSILDVYQLACREMGFGWSKEEVEKHFLRTCETGRLPTYVWSFLDRERENILENYYNIGGEL